MIRKETSLIKVLLRSHDEEILKWRIEIYVPTTNNEFVYLDSKCVKACMWVSNVLLLLIFRSIDRSITLIKKQKSLLKCFWAWLLPSPLLLRGSMQLMINQNPNIKTFSGVFPFFLHLNDCQLESELFCLHYNSN